MSRGSKLSRAIEYFETADYREARVAFTIVKEVMEQRIKAKVAQEPVKRRRSRKALVAEPSVAITGTAGAVS